MEKPKSPDNWVETVNKSPVRIAVAGEIPGLAKNGVAFEKTQWDRISEADAQGIWITRENIDTYTSFENVGHLKRQLQAGKVVMFISDEAPGKVWSKFGVPGESFHDSQGNDRQVGFYLWEELEGTIKVGTVFTMGDASSEVMYDALLEQTINHLGRMNHNNPGGVVAAAKLDPFSVKRAYAEGNYLDPAPTGFVYRFDEERNWLYNSGNKYNEFSYYYVLPASVDTNTSYDYFLTVISSQMVPLHESSWYSDLLRIVSSAWVNLEQYGPKSSPGTGSVGYTVGVEGGSEGIVGQASFSRSWNVSELSIQDNSDWDTELLSITYDYTARNDYAQDTSVQDTAWVVKTVDGVSPHICHQIRNDFYHWFYTDEYLQTEVCNWVP